jgi:hypothetical protein
MPSNEFKINEVNIYVCVCVCVCENTNNDYFIKYLYIDDILILDDNIKYMIKFTKNMLTNKFD